MKRNTRIIVMFLWVVAAALIAGLVAMRHARSNVARMQPPPMKLEPGQVVEVDESGAPVPKGVLPVLYDAPHFTLTDASGKPFDTQSLKGQIWLARFFFSECPGICPMATQALSKLQRTVTSPDVRFVSFTVDPLNDTPEKLAGYMEHWRIDSTRNIFLTGTPDQMRAVPLAFRYAEVIQPADHTGQIILIDRAGRVRGLYESNDDADMTRLATDTQRLLNSTN